MGLHIFRVKLIFVRYFSYDFHKWVFLSTTWLAQYTTTCASINWFISRETSRNGLLQRFSEWRCWYSVVLDGVLINCCISERTDWFSVIFVCLVGFIFISWSLGSVEPWSSGRIGPVCEIVWHSVCSHYNGLIYFIVITKIQ